MSTVENVPDIEAHRSHLIGVGYRLTGSRVDAEDAVQEAWLRLHRLPPEGRAAIRDLRAWLTTVVGRLCLDRLRSASVRRETYVGPWLPEPLVSTLPLVSTEDDPLATVVRDEDVRMAAMVVLDRLTPPQRVAFVLHDALGSTFDEIADVLGCSVPTARQHASRARRAVGETPAPPRAEPGEQGRLLAAVADALQRADTAALVSLLHPDVAMVNDSDGKTQAARNIIRGADKVARLLIGLTNRYGPEWLSSAVPVLVNGELGYRTTGGGGSPGAVTVFSVADGRIAAVYSVLNPEKLPPA